MAKLQDYFGRREQYTDSQFDLALDLKLLKNKTELLELKLDQYLNIENKLCEGLQGTLREIYEPYTQHNIASDYLEICHKIWELDQEDVKEWFAVLERAYPKQRSIVFYGPSNCGKSLLANALMSIFAPGYIQRDGGTNVHWLENIYRKSFIIWEEPSVHMTNIEDVKLLLGGENIAINRKNKNILSRDNGAAVLITTNKSFWEYEPQTLRNRCKIYEFNKSVESVTNRKLTSNVILTYLCIVYDGRLNEYISI